MVLKREFWKILRNRKAEVADSIEINKTKWEKTFRKNRSATFIIRQVVEKAIEFNTPLPFYTS